MRFGAPVGPASTRSFAPPITCCFLHEKTLFLILALGASTAAHAQYRGRGGNVSLGLKAGASLTDFAGKDASLFSNRFGFHAGVFANIGFTKLFAFQPEVIYSQKGAHLGNNSDVGLRLHYIDVPLVFHVNTDGFFFEARPQVGFLVAAKSEVGNTSTSVTNNFKTADFGYLAGLGYQLKDGLGIGLRYNGGFINVYKNYLVGPVTV